MEVKWIRIPRAGRHSISGARNRAGSLVGERKSAESKERNQGRRHACAIGFLSANNKITCVWQLAFIVTLPALVW